MYDEITPPPATAAPGEQPQAEAPSPPGESELMEQEKSLPEERTQPDTEILPVEELSVQSTSAPEAGVPQEKEQPPRSQPGTGLFFAALIPFLALILIGGILLGIRLTSGKSGSIFSLSSGEAGEPISNFLSNASEEVRGVYIATAYNINYPSAQDLNAKSLRAELDAIIETCLENGLNAIYFQASPNSDALYASELLPTSSVLTGKEGDRLPSGFDPLGYLCDAAHDKGISVHAWVNPMRVTGGSLDYDDLSAKNPAKKNPDWVVQYGEEHYYNLGIPEVRELQAQVCAELVENYPVDGILFDDYFYPYPEEGQAFDDSAAYAAHDGEYATVAEFRRACSTELVRECYTAIKAVRADCAFGIAPFGIWQNDDGKNGGSPTRGFEGYESLYCDSIAFIKEGIIDYIAPQLYWQFSSTAAPYGTLCDWWNAAVSGTEVKLLISHAAYMVTDWQSEGEFTEQIEYARNRKGYRGSLFYGYAAIAENQGGLCDELDDVYGAKYVYSDFYSTGEEVAAILRAEGDTLTVKGTSDVAYPLYYNGAPVSQNKDGSFTFTCPVPDTGTLLLTQNGKDYLFQIQGE